MEINREFWSGNTRHLTDSNNNNVVNFIDNSLYTDITANSEKYIAVDWDKTICPWKINAKSDFFNMSFMLGYGGGYEELITTAETKLFKERKKGYTFYISTNGKNNITGANSRMFPVWLATLSRNDIDLSDTVASNWVQDKFKELHPVINFDYSKIFAIPFLQAKNEGAKRLFGADLENNWNAANYSSWGVVFFYEYDNAHTMRDCAFDIVSLNNRYNIPNWDCMTCFDSEEFDNGLCLISYGVSSSNVNYYAQMGERIQLNRGAAGTYYNPQNYQSVDIAGLDQYYPNRMIWINGTNNTDIYDTNYYGGFIGSDSLRPFRRTFKSSLTYADFVEYLKEQLAYLGFRFCVDSTHMQNSLNSEYFYIPVIDDKGVTTGGYYQANSEEAQTLPNYSWTDNVFSVTPYDGADDEEDEDPNNYDETLTTDLNPYAYSYHSKFINYYCMDSAGLKDIINYVYSDLPTTQPEDDYLTNSPIDCVVSIMMFPFKVSHSSEWYYPFFGKVKCTDNVVHLPTSHIQIIECGQHLFYPHFGENDFRNYTPYTSAELYLPYCGNVKIEPTIYLNKLIGIKYIVDLITGACTALIFRAEKGAQNYGLLTEMINGQIGITLPTTGIKSNDLQRDILNKQAAYRQASNTAMISGANAALSLFTAFTQPSLGGAVGALNSVVNWSNATDKQQLADYDVKHIQVPFSVKGSASSICALGEEPTPYLTIRYAKMLPEYDPEIYGHSVGFATIENGVIGNYSGFTVVTGVDMSGISATEEEKALIKKYLESGVYL